jgi:hypothetical protein
MLTGFLLTLAPRHFEDPVASIKLATLGRKGCNANPALRAKLVSELPRCFTGDTRAFSGKACPRAGGGGRRFSAENATTSKKAERFPIQSKRKALWTAEKRSRYLHPATLH